VERVNKKTTKKKIQKKEEERRKRRRKESLSFFSSVLLLFFVTRRGRHMAAEDPEDVSCFRRRCSVLGVPVTQCEALGGLFV